MSLINDALKKAKAAQPGGAPAPDLSSLRADYSPRHNNRKDFLLSAFVGAIMVVAVLLLWQWFRSGQTIVHARTLAEPAQQASAPAPAVVTPMAAVAPKPLAAPAKEPAVAAAPAATSVTTAPAPTPVAVAPATPPAPAYKLQSIFYSPKNPSTVINGKLLLIGDRVGEARVKAIERDAVTIVTRKGETKVLDLP